MEKLTVEKRTAILRCLSEGMSIASTTRITGAVKSSVLRTLEEVGEACAAYHREHAVNLTCDQLQLDEQWSYCGCKEDTKQRAKLEHKGNVWCWTALCADTKFLVNWHVGNRTIDDAHAFCSDLGARFIESPQVSTDGLPAYRVAVPRGFGPCDFAQLIKIYKEVKGKLVVTQVKMVRRTGTPDMSRLSTSYIERQNLTTRQSNRRLTRATLGYSKKLENHEHMLALTYFFYNYTRKHMTVKCTPAQAIGVTDHQWSFEEVISMTDAYLKAKLDAMFEAAFAENFDLP